MLKRFRLFIRITLIGLLLYSFWLMIQLSLPYTAMKPGIDFLETKQFVYHIKHWRYSFYIHVFTSILVLVCGLMQFSSYVIARLPKLHRISGYVYIVTVLLISGPTALVLGFYANGGWPARTSFILLAICWLSSTYWAYRMAIKRRFMEHGKWMLRSYALTLSAISLRTYALLFDVFHINMHPVQVYILISWTSWIPNLLVAEWLLRREFTEKLLKHKQPATAL